MSAQTIPLELIKLILKNLVHTRDLLQCALTCKAWCFVALELIWYKPNLIDKDALAIMCKTLNNSHDVKLYSHAFNRPYAQLIRRINLTALSANVKDTDLSSFKVCGQLERATLSGCNHLTDKGLLDFLDGIVGQHLISLDLSDISHISNVTIVKIADTCPKLQGLNLSMSRECKERSTGVTDESIVWLAKNCPDLRRIKLSQCTSLTDQTATALAEHLPELLEVDLMSCSITNKGLSRIFARCRLLRECRISQCCRVTDDAFMHSALCAPGYYEQLRILVLTAVWRVTDEALQKIVEAAPRLRYLVLNKCKHITDEGVQAICSLGRFLHYVHLGHCDQITDASVSELARSCTHLRYLDLAHCWQLTDRSVIEISSLPKLKRIGLVMCANITDHAIYALSQSRAASTLERVHLSYCPLLTPPSIKQLVLSCKRLCHLSLTQVPAFIRPEFQQFCNRAPEDFSPQQQRVFCVFSGKGVHRLRHYLESIPLHHLARFPPSPHRSPDAAVLSEEDFAPQ